MASGVEDIASFSINGLEVGMCWMLVKEISRRRRLGKRATKGVAEVFDMES